eukprot:TRINITY_DN322_c0_g3_i1.p1 TRINITY_DN322_c0_g3~~TRINITY_DN322_c0_g3_i1.p1  ORF type:complete len:148 (+),score=45.32 TRINITY_DN322_c0_g3_i1:84-527(+)
MFFLINVKAIAGEHDYFEVAGKSYCVAQPWVMVFWLIPICPVGQPRLMTNNHRAPHLCGPYRFVPFKETPQWSFLKAVVYTILRLLTLGLICLYRPQASDERKRVLLEAAGLKVRDVEQPEEGEGGGGNLQGSNIDELADEKVPLVE